MVNREESSLEIYFDPFQYNDLILRGWNKSVHTQNISNVGGINQLCGRDEAKIGQLGMCRLFIVFMLYSPNSL